MLWRGVFLRDVALAFRQRSELTQPVMFLLLVVTLFPLGVGPGPETLQRIGPGVIWIAAILSSLLGMERLFRDDFQDGSLEQLLLSGIPLTAVATSKVLCHWLVTSLPIVILSPLLALFLNQTWAMYQALLVTLLIGTPILSLVGAIAVALTVGIARGGVLLSLLLIPVFIPVLIFATSAVEAASMQLPYLAHIAIIGAILLLTLALAPFAIAYALRVSHN